MIDRLARRRGLVCVVTDRERLLPGATIEEQCRAVERQARIAAEAGVDLFQVREARLADAQLLALVEGVRQAAAGSPLQVLVNDRVDLAIGAGLDGVHLPAAGLPVEEARRLLPEAVIGKSTHQAEEVAAASVAGADYVLFGTIFRSASKPEGHPCAGLPGLERAVRASTVPVLAIGGVDATNVADLARLADGVAAIGWFATLDAGELQRAVRIVRFAFDTVGPLI